MSDAYRKEVAKLTGPASGTRSQTAKEAQYSGAGKSSVVPVKEVQGGKGRRKRRASKRRTTKKRNTRRR